MSELYTNLTFPKNEALKDSDGNFWLYQGIRSQFDPDKVYLIYAVRKKTSKVELVINQEVRIWDRDHKHSTHGIIKEIQSQEVSVMDKGSPYISTVCCTVVLSEIPQISVSVVQST